MYIFKILVYSLNIKDKSDISKIINKNEINLFLDNFDNINYKYYQLLYFSYL